MISKNQYELMKLGTMVHEYLEFFDFKNPCIEKIENKEVQKIINRLLQCSIFQNIDKAKVYQEYEFIDEEENQELHGIIDLMLVYDDYIDIIDYKLSNIYDEHYDEQLNGYYKYIQKKTDKKINLYLYSLISGNFREVKKVVED